MTGTPVIPLRTEPHPWLLPLSPRAQSVAVGLIQEAIAAGVTEPDAVRRWVVEQTSVRLFGASSEQGRLYIEVRLRLAEYPDSARGLIERRVRWMALTEQERNAFREASRLAFQADLLEAFKAQRAAWAEKADRRASRGRR